MTCQKFTKKLTHLANLPELYKRCPPNQLPKFLQMRDKNAEYAVRVNKYPEQLPRIDWEFYRANVRTEYVKIVDEFELKYAELNKIFDSRHDLVDTSSYYTEVEQLAKEVKIEVDNYIVESNKRIATYEEEIARIRALIPYEQMTVEQFCEMCPDHAKYYPCDGKPSFWPHTPEEQTPGEAGVQKTPEQMAEEENAERLLKEAQEAGITVAAATAPMTAAKAAGQPAVATTDPAKEPPAPANQGPAAPAETAAAQDAKKDTTAPDKDPEKK